MDIFGSHIQLQKLCIPALVLHTCLENWRSAYSKTNVAVFIIMKKEMSETKKKEGRSCRKIEKCQLKVVYSQLIRQADRGVSKCQSIARQMCRKK